MLKNSYKWVAKCDNDRIFFNKSQLASLPQKIVVIEDPFHQWGIDFIGPINLPSSIGYLHAIIATYIFTKWVESLLRKLILNSFVSSSKKTF